MDIEGAEDRALRGGEATFRRFRPPVLLEVHGIPGGKALSWLQARGYANAGPNGVPPNQTRHAVATYPATID
jgi:peptidoglycan hydrolase-like protein with peptidoglycan-binding domain